MTNHLGLSDARGMEHRWLVYYVQIWPRYREDWTEVSAESKQEALDKVAAGLNARSTLPTDWKFDPNRDPEMVL